MKLNWLSYYLESDGYGRFSSRMVAALQRAGIEVLPLVRDQREMPPWMQRKVGIDWNNLTISCFPPRNARPLPGQQWLFTMCEGSHLPKSWVKAINTANLQKILVPCQHNLEVYVDSGVKVPVEIVPLGIDPLEFPILPPRPDRPYTFLALGDRGGRKGYEEVFDAFYRAFGGKTTGAQDVRLIFKNRKGSNRILRFLSRASELDQRLSFIAEDVESMAEVYAQADCFVIPSYCEGWGLPHREAAAMGLTVITQKYSGMDDGHTEEWALVTEGGTFEQHAYRLNGGGGGWLRPNVDNLAAIMLDCYQRPAAAARKGLGAAHWLRENQTWDHTAQLLLHKIRGDEDGLQVVRTTEPGFLRLNGAIRAADRRVGQEASL